MDLPPALRYDQQIRIERPSDGAIDLPKPTPTFERWQGAMPSDTYGGKPVLDAGGEPAFAELAILRLLLRAGWDGVWVDTYRNQYRRGYWNRETSVTLPGPIETLLDSIADENESRSGCFDVCAWSSEAVLFAEATRAGHDQMRATQRRWVESAVPGRRVELSRRVRVAGVTSVGIPACVLRPTCGGNSPPAGATHGEAGSMQLFRYLFPKRPDCRLCPLSLTRSPTTFAASTSNSPPVP